MKKRMKVIAAMLICCVVGCGKIDESEYVGLDSKALMNRANELLKKRQYRDALFLCELGIELDEVHAGCWYFKAVILNDLRRYEESLEATDRALYLFSKDKKAPIWILYRLKSHSLYKLKRFDEALGSIYRVIECKPEYYSAWELKAKCLYRQERYREALVAVDKALGFEAVGSGLYWKRLIEHQL